MWVTGKVNLEAQGSSWSNMQGQFRSSNGRPLTLRDTANPILIPCYDLCSGSPFLFAEASAKHTQNYNFIMWEVCHATMCSQIPCALQDLRMPIPIKSVDMQTTIVGIDRGFMMNNPTAVTITMC